MVFVMRKLDAMPTSLGEKLRALRKSQGMTFEMMVEKTGVQPKYLRALEFDQFHLLPEPLYTRHFLKAYVNLLGGDEQYFVELYEEECGKCDLIDPMRLPRERVGKKRLFLWNKFVKGFIFSCLFIAVFGYFGKQMLAVLEPPQVTIFSPVNEVMTHDPTIRVEGLVDGETVVYVNGELAILDDKNIFAVSVELTPGLNTILIEAEKRYSKKTEIERMIVFEPEQSIGLK